MKLESLTVRGFRSLKDGRGNPGDLNVVIGPNASGKSNLLRFLELISASAQGGLRKFILAESGIEPMVWGGRADEIQCEMAVTESGAASLEYSTQIKRSGGSDYTVEREDLRDVSAGVPAVLISRTSAGSAEVAQAKTGEASALATLGNLEKRESVLSQLNRLELPERAGAFKEYVSGWSVYNDFYTSHNAPVRQSAVTQYEKRLAPDGQNLLPVMHTLYTENRDFKRDIDLGMKAAFGDEFEEVVFRPAASQRIELGIRWKSLQEIQTAASLSDGTLRFLFLLTALANPAPGALIAIDEPETGLHPSMLPIIAEYAVHAAHDSQVILTTHSVAFLDAFSETKPTTTIAQWENGETKLKTLENEVLAYWLKCFSLGDLFRSRTLENME